MHFLVVSVESGVSWQARPKRHHVIVVVVGHYWASFPWGLWCLSCLLSTAHYNLQCAGGGGTQVNTTK